MPAMDSRFQRIAVYVVIIAVLVGIGFLIYRFVQGPTETNVKTLVINRDGKFTTDDLDVDNNEVVKVKNEDDKNHTVKKSPSNETFVDVDANSTSRELALPDDSETTLYLADDENETVIVTNGTPEVAEEETEEPESPAPSPEPATGSATNLPDTGPEGIYLFPVFATLGFALVKLSNKILRK